MKNSLLLVSSALLLASVATQAQSREVISIVGSSTVYPFSTVVAERFGKKTMFKTPKIESTGTGGGMKLFCSGLGVETPDITNSSRRMKDSEFEMCQKNGVTDIVEILIGYDGIAIANSVTADQFNLELKDIFLALAANVPNPDGSETFVPNPYKTWKDVNPTLPAIAIEVLGPPPTSGTRDAFAELAMEGGCQSFPYIKAMSKNDKEQYQSVCHTVREDGAYIEAGENDNLIVQKLEANPAAVGIFGFSFLDQNSDKVQSSIVNGVAAEFETIADGNYPVSRPLYFYVKAQHVDQIPGIKGYLAEFVAEPTFGEDGYLADKGMIPLDAEKRKEVGKAAREMIPLRTL